MIHESVVIAEGAIIADDVTIGPFCNIGKDVVLASGVQLESNIILKGKLDIGQDVHIFSFVTIGREESEISIGAKTHVREFVQIASQEDENKTAVKTTIAANCFIMAYVQILSGVTLAEYCILTNAVRVYENVQCETRVIIGGLSTIEADNKIGTGVMIGGASYVNHDLPPFTLVEGNNASIKGLNIVGLRRRLKNKDDLEEIKSIYKRILMGGVDKEVAKELSLNHENEYVKMFSAFISDSNLPE